MDEIKAWTGSKDHKHVCGAGVNVVLPNGRHVTMLELYRHAVDLDDEFSGAGRGDRRTLGRDADCLRRERVRLCGFLAFKRRCNTRAVRSASEAE